MRHVTTALVALVVWFTAAPSWALDTATIPPLRVGTSGDYAPFSVVDAEGRRRGFDIDVAERLAADLGRRIEFVPFQWPDLAGALQQGRFDIAMSGVTQRPERALVAVLTRPYAITGAVAVIRASDRARYATIAALDQPHVRLAVNRGGHLEREAHRLFPAARIIPTADNPTLPGLLQRSEVDAALSEQFEARTWDATAFTTIGPFTRDRKVYALPRAAAALAEPINDWLAAREADGWLNLLRERWLGAEAVMTPAQAGFEAVVATIDLRMGLMPLMGAVKRRDHVPLIDVAQRARVLDQVGRAAKRAGLEPDGVADFFAVQIQLAEDIQTHGTDIATPADPAVADMRAAVSVITEHLIAELRRAQPWLQDPTQRGLLSTTVRSGLTAPQVTVEEMNRVAATLERIQRTVPALPSATNTPAAAHSAPHRVGN